MAQNRNRCRNRYLNLWLQKSDYDMDYGRDYGWNASCSQRETSMKHDQRYQVPDVLTAVQGGGPVQNAER